MKATLNALYPAIRESQEDEIYRLYITDVLKAIAQANGLEIGDRYADFVADATQAEEEDTRPVKKIASEIWQRIRGNNERI